MAVQLEFAARDATIDLGQRQRQLRKALGWHRPGVAAGMVGDDGGPDPWSVEFRVLFAAACLLAPKAFEIHVADVVSAQVDALVGEEVPDRSKRVLAVVMSTDLDQRAVDVERYRRHVHTALPLSFE